MSDVMTLQETAEYLRLHPVTLRSKARKGQIPASKIGRQWRFSRAQLLAWIEQGAELSTEMEDWALAEIAAERLSNPKRRERPFEEFLAELGR